MLKFVKSDYDVVRNELSTTCFSINQNKFDDLKNRLSYVINSTRALYYINDVGKLLNALEKRAVTGSEKDELIQLLLKFVRSCRGTEESTECPLSSHVMDIVSDEIGRKWLNMARYLKVPENIISEIDVKYHDSLKERAYQVLLTVRKRKDIKTELMDALTKCRRVDLRTRVEREWLRKNC